MSVLGSTTIYVRLLDEGVDVWRPVLATDLGGGRFRLPDWDYDPDLEVWEFLPGTVVEASESVLGEEQVLVAVRQAASD